MHLKLMYNYITISTLADRFHWTFLGRICHFWECSTLHFRMFHFVFSLAMFSCASILKLCHYRLPFVFCGILVCSALFLQWFQQNNLAVYQEVCFLFSPFISMLSTVCCLPWCSFATIPHPVTTSLAISWPVLGPGTTACVPTPVRLSPSRSTNVTTQRIPSLIRYDIINWFYKKNTIQL